MLAILVCLDFCWKVFRLAFEIFCHGLLFCLRRRALQRTGTGIMDKNVNIDSDYVHKNIPHIYRRLTEIFEGTPLFPKFRSIAWSQKRSTGPLGSGEHDSGA